MYRPSQAAVDISQNVAVSKYRRAFLTAVFHVAKREEAALKERKGKKKLLVITLFVGKLPNMRIEARQVTLRDLKKNNKKKSKYALISTLLTG